MTHLFVVARLTVSDINRRRIFWLLVLVGVAFLFMSFFLRDLTIGQWRRIIVDLGLAATEMSVTLTGILIGATLISGDIDRRTAYPILATPISRSTFVLGKFLGLVAILGILVVIMVAGTLGILFAVRQHDFVSPVLQNAATITVGAIAVSSIAVAASTFTTTTLSAMLGLSVALGGHFVSNLEFFGKKAGFAAAKIVMVGFAHLLPDLEALNLKTLAASNVSLTNADLFQRLGYGLAYALAVVMLGALTFNARDIK